MASADVSFNSELDVIDRLSVSAGLQQRRHAVVLMVELGDLREGIMPRDLLDTVRQVLGMPGVVLCGLGANLACQSGVVPDATNMAELSDLVEVTERTFDVPLRIVSGGNSATLEWALDPCTETARINQLRLGEAILLGREPLHRCEIEGLHTDAFTLVAEVIESKTKPSQPWGELGQTAFGQTIDRPRVSRDANRVIVSVGRQDIEPSDLSAPSGTSIIGASSDHLVLDTGTTAPAVGTELRFGVGYSSLLRSMTSPFVGRLLISEAVAGPDGRVRSDPGGEARASSQTDEPGDPIGMHE